MVPTNTPAKDFLLYKADEPHLAKLPAATRTALEAVTNDGAHYKAVAATLNTPIGTIKSRINRAREQILKMRAEAAAAAEQQKAVA